MARKPTAKPFRLKYTDGKKADRTAFFQMANQSMPNPAVDQAINKKMEEKITEKVDQAVSKPGDSPTLQKGERLKKVGKILKKVASGAATALTHGLDAVYGTGKINTDPSVFSKDKDKDKKEQDAPDVVKDVIDK
mgnify:FL=1